MTNPIDRIAADATGASRVAAVNEDATERSVAEAQAAHLDHFMARVQSRLSPLADWTPGGWRDREVRDDEARSKEEAERERRGFIRDDSDAEDAT